MDRLRFIEHAGARILYFDFRDVSDPGALLPLLEQAKAIVAKEPPKSVLTLTNVSGLHFDSKSVTAFKAMVEHNRPYIRASAVVGLSGLMRVIYAAVQRLAGRQIPTFADEASARAWLVTQGDGRTAGG